VVSPQGRTISVKKKNKIQSWPHLKTKRDVRMFLGLCVYVRMFIRDFSDIAAPLLKIKKDRHGIFLDRRV
jgi:hypothetical protein